MCGRFSARYTWQEIHTFLSVIGAPLNLRPRYNVSPTNDIDVVRLRADGQRELVSMRWGLVPSWWKRMLKEAPASFNARSEEIDTKPMFRDAWRKGRRCLIPASGFYEWTGPKTNRQPHYFTAADGSPLIAFAGLWDWWRDPATGEEILSATILTTDVSQWMAAYHNRMPVILRSEDFGRWLEGNMTKEELRPAGEDALREWRVSNRVNKSGAGDDDPSVVLWVVVGRIVYLYLMRDFLPPDTLPGIKVAVGLLSILVYLSVSFCLLQFAEKLAAAVKVG